MSTNLNKVNIIPNFKRNSGALAMRCKAHQMSLGLGVYTAKATLGIWKCTYRKEHLYGALRWLQKEKMTLFLFLQSLRFH